LKELRDRVAVVTGGASGIGEALALACADQGMQLVIADLEGGEAERVAQTVRARGGRAVSVPTDVASRDSVEALAERTYRELGACHLLCNNAGVLVVGPLEATSDQDWDWLLGVNLRGVINGVQAFLPRMLQQQGERQIVNTSSINGLVPLPAVGAYGTTKHAVVGFSEALRAELVGAGIGVSVVCPGGVATRITESERNRPLDLGSSRSSPEDLRAMISAAGDRPDHILEPHLVAQAILEGVRRNDAYVITHPEHRPRVERRFRELMAAFDRAEARGSG
jgi:NAD(P)-dependent dehydrogenase (short-subunit alcohol dehydrogenase family)